ncbi:hypothetical protein MNBD_BACTEROID06-588 [hydrothermal vent metagenome]|uniref:Uncharacterized protein n=1 Tax=hydrothermal vent metagenome TaxID=652676 RepID=A0A3B0UNU6_9ZZZZ
MSVAQKLLIGLTLSILIGIGQQSYAQIDSRNQEKPAKQQATSPKKTKKTKKIKKSRKERKQAKGKKIYSNKKQIRNSKKSFKKGGDKGYKGDIAGRKVKKIKTTPRKTYARPQPDPYAGRQIRTEKQRAGPPPRKVKTATKKGEVARTGDISGRKRIRQRSVSTNPKPVHRQPNTYRGVKRRTERDRAYSNKKQIQSVRSVSRPSETRKPKTTTRVVTATAPHRVKRKKNVYRNHTQRKGEQASTKDIAGKKLRTKNHKSPRPSGGGRAMANPKIRSDKTKSGERFKKHKIQSAGTRSVSRSSEKSGGGKPIANQRNMKNFRSQKAKTVIQAKPVRSYGNRKKGNGEAAIFGAYGAKKIRSATRKSESKPGKRKPSAPSISGARVFSNKKVHPYRGKDRRFSGEHSSNKDIAGKSLRTKNYRSRRPNYSAFGSMNNRSASASPSNKRYNSNKAKSISGSSFNNNASSITKRTIGAGVGVFAGKSKSKKAIKGGGSISAKWNNNGNPLIRKGGDTGVGRFAGNMKYQKSAKGGGSVSKRWNNGGNPLIRKGDDTGIGRFAGNMKYQKTNKGGGSISKRWNNNGNPLMKKDRGDGTAVATTYQGNVFPRGMNNPNIGSYQGDIKAKKRNTKGYPTQDFIGNVRVVSKKPPRAPGTEYGSTKKIAGIKIGTGAGLMQPVTSKRNKDINTLTFKVKEKEKTRSEGTTLGEKRSFSFVTIGNPTKSGLVYQRKRLKVNNDLPDQLSRDQKKRVKAAPGTIRGNDWALSFWTFGSPAHMGLQAKHAKAKGKMHPSTGYSYSKSNAVDAKDKPVSIKLLWAKLFKKNAATSKPDKEYSHKLKYDKDEREIWETEDREDWYKN